MTRPAELATAYGCGLLFAVGLGVGGMTRPSNVLGFLDVTGPWNASLLFVMGGAVTVTLILFPWILRRPRPEVAERFVLPQRTRIDVPLVAGAVLFGIGWGVAGFCPGPAVVSVAAGAPGAAVFVGAMLIGLYAARLVPTTPERPGPTDRAKEVRHG